MRLLNTELDKRLPTQLDKSIIVDNGKGVIKFGENNDYPQKIEKIVNGSITAKSISNIYSKFLCGQGFNNSAINDIVIGKDERYKDITIRSLLRQVCDSIALNNGCYIHVNVTRGREIKYAKIAPFKYIRFSKPDDNGYSAKVYSHINWEKDPAIKSAKGQIFDKKDIKIFDVFNLNENVFNTLVGENIEGYNGQIYCHFQDNTYTYPLSPFDPVYLDSDTEFQISLYKNRSIRNGMFDKTVFRVVSPKDENEREELKETIENFLGPDSDNVLVLEDEIDPATGQIKKDGAFAIDKIPSNVNADLFESWERSLMNNIRKACKGLPSLLIDYDEGKLSGTSGESIQQAVNFYNAMTLDDRAGISKMFKEIFSNSVNPELKNNIDWSIKPLSLT